MYWNGDNLIIDVVNNVTSLQLHDEFFLNDVIQLNEYMLLYCDYMWYQWHHIATINNIHNNVM
jgi:hypothetical protein